MSAGNTKSLTGNNKHPISRALATSPTIVTAILLLLSIVFPQYRGLALGLLAIGVAAQPLKELFALAGIGESRPCCAKELGMPSGHAMFGGFLAALGPTVLCTAGKQTLCSVLLYGYAGAVAAQRIASGKHTLAQVFVGLAIGAGAGFAVRRGLQI